jgi:phosphate acetyltransferase
MIRERTRARPKRVVIADGTDPRGLKAAVCLLSDNLASELILLGDKAEILRRADELGLNIGPATLIDPATAPERESLSRVYRECHHNRITEEQAFTETADVLNFGNLLVRQGRADCLIGGADHPTADLIRSAWWIIGMKPDVKTLSSSFLMILPDARFGADGLLLYADCAVVPQPNPHQLADIADASARTFRSLIGRPPVVGFLSFSTKGSAEHEHVQKVRLAVTELASRNPDFAFDGELQFDAAILPAIAAKKAPGSPAAGHANVLVFPDLDAGNICYKITERLANAKAIGPLLQGLAKPVSDLSRGCSWEDICDTAVVVQNMD